MKVSDFDYQLPGQLIAQQPAPTRDASRLLVVDRQGEGWIHSRFSQLLNYLRPGDCLVLNDSKVIPARLKGRKVPTGGKVEFLLSRPLPGGLWETMVRPGKRLAVGDRVAFGSPGELTADIVGRSPDGMRQVRFSCQEPFMEVLERLGTMPLPPYIDREATEEDALRYQTVYSRWQGSVAAPTAGLHFTPELLTQAARQGIALARVTLHVGLGTFRPVSCQQVEDHRMHVESYRIGEEAAAIINETKAGGGRVIAVGTTACRTLESGVDDQGLLAAGGGDTGIFIYPGYRFRLVDGLITNFHLPKSTLLMLVSAFYDREKMLAAYQEAIEKSYRFFSYGDAMLII